MTVLINLVQYSIIMCLVQTKKMESFVVCRAKSADDLQFVLKITEELQWTLEACDLDAFYSADPSGFFIGELNGQRISHVCMVKYPHVTFVGLYVVDQAYRKKGYGLKTWKHVFPHDDTISVALVSVPEMKDRYIQLGFRQEWINKEYLFKVSNFLSIETDHLIVKPVSEVDFEKLLEYDTACFGGSRRSFLQKWIALPGRISLVATDEHNDIIGYTVARKMQHPENGYTIGPLFANNVSVAKTLLNEAVENSTLQAKQESEITYAVPITEYNTAASELPEELGGVIISTYVGMCKQKLPPSMVAGFSKVFAVTTQEIG